MIQSLTRRETEVVTLVAQGITNKEIGYRLCITENTTKRHVSAILAKLHLDNRVHIALYALREQLVAPIPPSLLVTIGPKGVQSLLEKGASPREVNELLVKNEWKATPGGKLALEAASMREALREIHELVSVDIPPSKRLRKIEELSAPYTEREDENANTKPG